MVKDYNSFATENKGIFRIGSVDCGEFAKICDKEKVTKFPTVRVYPTHPIPTSDIDTEKFDVKQLKKSAGKYYQDKSIEITANNLTSFLNISSDGQFLISLDDISYNSSLQIDQQTHLKN